MASSLGCVATKSVLSIFHLKLYKPFSFLLFVLTPFNFVLPDNKVWNGAGIAGGMPKEGCPALGAALGAAVEPTCSSSGLSDCLWDLMAEEEPLIPAPYLNPERNNCTMPTWRAPCDFVGVSHASCPRSVCPELLLLPCCLLPQVWPGLRCVVVCPSRFFIALWVSLSWKTLLQSFRTLFRSSVAWGFLQGGHLPLLFWHRQAGVT